MVGPPGTGARIVTGATPADDGLRFHFVPPSSVLHRRDLIGRVGPWREYRELQLPPDYDFLLRAWEDRPGFACSDQLTVFKFNAWWRPNSYRERRSDEQAAYARRIQSEPDFLLNELLTIVKAYAGRLAAVDLSVPVDAPPGWIVERNRAVRGLDPRPVRAEPVSTIRYEFGDYLPGSGWHAVEHSAEHGPYRWSGPDTRATLEFALRTDRDLGIRFRVLAAVDPANLDSLALLVNNQPITLAQTRDAMGARIYTGVIGRAAIDRAGERTVLAIVTDRTVSPQAADPGSSDKRLLGVALNWLEIAPIGGDTA
jgi:hypothetical protein